MALGGSPPPRPRLVFRRVCSGLGICVCRERGWCGTGRGVEVCVRERDQKNQPGHLGEERKACSPSIHPSLLPRPARPAHPMACACQRLDYI